MKYFNIVYLITVVLLIVISFFLFSSRFYPLLNSDDALNILMTYYYKLPNDLYCWGQDRGGTLIPLISRFFHIILGVSPVYSVSFANYLILFLGYIGFSSLFNSNSTKIIFALVWFFPPITFIDLTRFPLGVQYSLIGFTVFLINKINYKNKKALYNHFLLLFIVLLFSTSIWVSDLAVVSITLLLIVLLVFQFFEEKKLRFNYQLLPYIIGGIFINYLFIKYAKSHATAITKNYTSFNDINSFLQGIDIVKTEIIKTFLFKQDEIFLSLYCWLVLLCLIICLVSFKSTYLVLNSNLKKWLTFFITDFFAVFGVILLSKWVYLNGMGRWYFVPLYISTSITLLLIVDNFAINYFKKTIVKTCFFITVIVGSFSTLHYLKFVRPKSLKPQIDISSEFLKLGEIGIIGGFWNSYIISCANPTKIKATAHEGEVRNLTLAAEVFNQPKIYVIKDMWLNSFPDTLEQFGHTLIKKGHNFKLGNCDVNEYVKINTN